MTPPPACGTRGGYDRHLRRREVPCDACVQANKARVAATYQQRRDKALAQGRRATLAAAVYTTTKRRGAQGAAQAARLRGEL